MCALIPFQFENKEIRVVRDENGDPLFVGKDVCEALGYVDTTNAMKQHCKGVVKRHPLQTAGGMQDARVLSEPDVLRLIINCTLPAAQAFERLVFEEILPSIRKTGTYSAPVALSDAERFLQSAQLFVAMEHRAAKMEQAQVVQLKVAAPSVAFVDQYVDATGLLGFRQGCKLIKAKENQFSEFLRARGIWYRLGSAWVPHAQHIDAGPGVRPHLSA